MYLTSWWYKTEWRRHSSNMNALIEFDNTLMVTNKETRKHIEELLNQIEDYLLVDLSDQVNAHVVRQKRVEQGIDPDIPF